MPSPSKYDGKPPGWDRRLLGVMEKCEGVNYLSNAEFEGLTKPGPDTYGVDH